MDMTFRVERKTAKSGNKVTLDLREAGSNPNRISLTIAKADAKAFDVDENCILTLSVPAAAAPIAAEPAPAAPVQAEPAPIAPASDEHTVTPEETPAPQSTPAAE